jgi:hypothetical protein
MQRRKFIMLIGAAAVWPIDRFRLTAGYVNRILKG